MTISYKACFVLVINRQNSRRKNFDCSPGLTLSFNCTFNKPYIKLSQQILGNTSLHCNMLRPLTLDPCGFLLVACNYTLPLNIPDPPTQMAPVPQSSPLPPPPGPHRPSLWDHHLSIINEEAAAVLSLFGSKSWKCAVINIYRKPAWNFHMEKRPLTVERCVRIDSNRAQRQVCRS